MLGNRDIKPIALATLANLSRTEDGGKNRTFNILEISARAAQLFSLDYNDMRNSLSKYLAGAVTSGQDPHFAGDPYHEFYMLTNAGRDFQATIVAAAAAAASGNNQKTSSSSSRDSHSERKISGSGLGIIYGQPIEYLVNQGTSRQHNPPAPAAAASSSQQAGNKRKADQLSSTPGRERWPETKSGSSSSSSNRPAISSQPTGKKPHGGGMPPKPVEQYDLATDRTIARFDSQGDAARAIGISRSGISQCISRDQEHAGGFGWRTPGTGGAAGATSGSHPSRPALSKHSAEAAASPSQQAGKKRKADNISSGRERWPEAMSGASSSSTSHPAISSQSTDNKFNSHSRAPKPVEQFDLATGRAIARFDSQHAAVRATGIRYGSITACARGGMEHGGGFGWRTPGTGRTAGAASGSRHSRPTLTKPSTEAAASSNQQAGKKRKADKLSPSTGRERWPEAESGSSSSSSSSRPASSNQPTGKKPRRGAHPHAKPVEQYDLGTGRTFARFDSHGDAARETGINYSSISTCARGEYSHAGGFGWRTPGTGGAAGAANGNRHSQPALSKPSTAAAAASSSQQAGKKRKADKLFPSSGRERWPEARSGSSSSSSSCRPASSKQPTDKKSRRGDVHPLGMPVEQYDLATGRMIARFDSQGDADRATGIRHGNISACVRGERENAGGFGWRTPGTGGAAGASAIRNKVTSTTAATTTRNGTTDIRPQTTSGGIIPHRFQRSDPFNIPFSKVTFHNDSDDDDEDSDDTVISLKPSASSAQFIDHSPHPRAPKPVEQHDLATGRAIARFDSQSAAARATGIDQATISNCINGKLTHGGGFGWRKLGTAGAAAASGNGMISKKPLTSNGQPTGKKRGAPPKPVEQYNLATGRAIAQFDSQNDADRATGINHGGISACVRGKLTQYGGFGWRTPETGAAVAASGNGAATQQAPDKAKTSTKPPPSSSSSSLLGCRTLGVGSGDGHYQSSLEAEGGEEDEDDEWESEQWEEYEEGAYDDNEVDEQEEEEEEEVEGVISSRVTNSPAATVPPITPASHAVRILAPSSSSSSASAPASSSSSSPSSPNQAAPPPAMITKRQRQDLVDVIFNRLLTIEIASELHRSVTGAEKSERISELFVRATTIEDVFFQYPPDEYQELFDPARLLDSLSYPSIKALCTL